MANDQGLTPIHQRFHSRDIISHRAPFPLEIVVLSRHPCGFFAGVFNIFIFVEFPDNVTIPIHLNEIYLVLKSEFHGSLSRASHNKSARKN